MRDIVAEWNAEYKEKVRRAKHRAEMKRQFECELARIELDMRFEAQKLRLQETLKRKKAEKAKLQKKAKNVPVPVTSGK